MNFPSGIRINPLENISSPKSQMRFALQNSSEDKTEGQSPAGWKEKVNQMGKNLIQQRRGKGTPRYRTPRHKYIGKIKYPDIDKKIPALAGTVTDIVHATGRTTPVAVVDFNGRKDLIIPSDDDFVGKGVSVIELSQIPEGAKIYNIELRPGDGGRLCRASGAFAMLITKENDKCTILLPSKEKKILKAQCRAMLGTAAGSGRTEKPFRKAGFKHFAMKARGKLYPVTKGVSMNAVDHPFGGKTSIGKQKTVSRHMPPGKKVGSISPKRTGKKKKA